jgi:maltooligosyltrehalose trehalohydrolase
MMSMTHARAHAPAIGAHVFTDGTVFHVWAPEIDRVELILEGSVDGVASAPGPARRMTPGEDGYHTIVATDAPAGTLYRYRLDGRGPFPDPASRWQPRGVHGPSTVVDPATFAWSDATWTGVPIERTILYELHIGTFTSEGTFAAAAARLPLLADLGITAVLVMPVADFPGARNWGYDGVAPFAPARCYGSPDDFRRFVDVAHQHGLAVHLDVVYNHLGPDGAYQSTFSRFYYSTTHQNPWGAGINFCGPHSAPVRAYFIENALRWVHEFHIDGLRLDATHAITDTGARHVIAELADTVRASMDGSARPVLVIAEDSRNLDTMVRDRARGGWGLDGVWADDFHHHLRHALAGDRDGYFADFDGTAASIAATARQGWFFRGQFSPYHGKARGTEPAGIPPERCVICLQNHDQVGNRAFGERLHRQVPSAAWRAASTLLLVLPETPLLFMGQEWAASAPFLYFTDHEPGLGRQVTEGRRQEFARFRAFSDPDTRERIPDPQAASTFERSRLDWTERQHEPHASTLRLYQRLLALRRSPAMQRTDGELCDIQAIGGETVVVHRGQPDGPQLLVVVRLRGSGRVVVDGPLAQAPHGRTWRRLFSTEDASLTTDPHLPSIEDGEGLVIEFRRPGAVVFDSRLGPGEVSS